MALKSEAQLYDKSDQDKVIAILMSKIRMLEQDKNDKKIVYFWLGNEPLSMSFLSEEIASSIMFMMDVFENVDEVEDEK